MKTYLYLDFTNNKLHAISAGSQNEAAQVIADEHGIDVATMVRVEVHPRSPKVVEWGKLSKTSEVKREAKEESIETREEIQE